MLALAGLVGIAARIEGEGILKIVPGCTFITAPDHLACSLSIGGVRAHPPGRLIQLPSDGHVDVPAHAEQAGVLLAGALGVSLAAYLNYILLHLQARKTDVLTAMGAAGLIILCQSPRISIGLRSRVARFFGRVSYSLYLVRFVPVKTDGQLDLQSLHRVRERFTLDKILEQSGFDVTTATNVLKLCNISTQ
jgi:peptidoglycan/LPS O-acetylase OafA/YrhL